MYHTPQTMALRAMVIGHTDYLLLGRLIVTKLVYQIVVHLTKDNYRDLKVRGCEGFRKHKTTAWDKGMP